MEPLDIIEKFYDRKSNLYKILLVHSEAVAQKALSIIRKHTELKIDEMFVYEAAMLHDIGIFMTDAPFISCLGKYPYIAHGYLGKELLEKEGYPRHALVCERHTGTGLTLREIIDQKLPVPHRDMVPVSIEEQVICFADCFYSKSHLGQEKTIDKIIKGLSKHGEQSVDQFIKWMDLFS